jgi:hypothetical protein
LSSEALAKEERSVPRNAAGANISVIDIASSNLRKYELLAEVFRKDVNRKPENLVTSKLPGALFVMSRFQVALPAGLSQTVDPKLP